MERIRTALFDGGPIKTSCVAVAGWFSAATVLGIIAFLLGFVMLCCGFTVPPLPPVKKAAVKPNAQPVQGAGALALISKAVVVGPTWRTNWLVWDYASTNMASVSNFQRFAGPSPGNYTSNLLCGLTLSNRIVWATGTVRYASIVALGTNGLVSTNSNEVRVPPWPLTNLVLTVTTTGSGLQWRNAANGAWTNLGTNIWPVTNPPGKIGEYRGLGTNRLTFLQRWQ